MGFFRGFIAPFHGAVFLARARLWHLALLPVLLNLALAGGAGWAAAHYWRQELGDRATALGSPALASVLLVVATTAGAIMLFVVLQPILGAIFNDILSERVERHVLGTAPRAAFFASAARALGHALLKLMLYGMAFVVGLGLGTVTAGLGGAVGVGSGRAVPGVRRVRLSAVPPFSGILGEMALSGPTPGANHRIWSRGDGILFDSPGSGGGPSVHGGRGHLGLSGNREPARETQKTKRTGR